MKQVDYWQIAGLPQTVDCYIIAFLIIKAFGHNIPWWGWLMLGTEAALSLIVKTLQKLGRI